MLYLENTYVITLMITLKNYKIFLSEINIIESSFEGFKKRFFEVIEQNNYLKEKEWMDFNEKYFNILIDRKGSEYLEKGFQNIQQLLGLS